MCEGRFENVWLKWVKVKVKYATSIIFFESHSKMINEINIFFILLQV